MRNMYLGQILLALLIFIASCAQGEKPNSNPILGEEVTISKETLKDKIKGGWAGQVIGCTYGGPIEFKYLGTMIQDYIPINWSDSAVSNYFETFPGLYDDIYMDLTFVDVIEKYGVEVATDSFAYAFANADYMLWAANQVGRYNILQGMKPPMSGHWLNNPHADDIDFQIESDFIGLMYPGMTVSAGKLADRIGHIMNYGDGFYGGLYVSTMYSLAFVSDDINFIVTEALKAIPQESSYYQCINDVIAWHKKYPNDWKQTWFECERKWSAEVGSPDGIFVPYNIDAKINSAYVVIGLLYGEGDFFKSMDISTRCGQDSDCNPATVLGILGAMKGYSQIPEKYTKALLPVEDINFAYSDISLKSVYDLSYKHAAAEIERLGGKVEDDHLVILTQAPEVAKYEKSFENHYPVKLIEVDQFITNDTKITFEGTGIVLKGWAGSSDEAAVAELEVYCDGELVEKCNLPVSFTKRRPEMFHKYQLPKGKHTLTFKWLNQKSDLNVKVTQAVVYSDAMHTVSY